MVDWVFIFDRSLFRHLVNSTIASTSVESRVTPLWAAILVTAPFWSAFISSYLQERLRVSKMHGHPDACPRKILSLERGTCKIDTFFIFLEGLKRDWNFYTLFSIKEILNYVFKLLPFIRKNSIMPPSTKNQRPTAIFLVNKIFYHRIKRFPCSLLVHADSSIWK